jgi:hypothetical protein
MKTNVTYVDAAKLEALILSAGLPMTAQKGFVKVSGAKGRNIYVAATKRVGRVDLSGFTCDWGVTPHCGEFGNVKQQLNFSQPEEAILADFAKTLELLASLPEVPAAERKPKSAPKTAAAQGWTTVQPKASRKELIEKVAKEKGVKVSEKTEAEFATQA